MVNTKMKKTYNQPTCLVVELSTKQIMLSESITVHTEDGAPAVEDASEILTKENKSIWDEEW